MAIETNDKSLPAGEINISNAGAVLLAAYIPQLFARMGLLENGGFIDREAAERAVHCLQFMVNKSLDSSEHQLVLNKLFCGIQPGLPIRCNIELTDEEREQLESMLFAITQNWEALKNTTLDGLRESFLQRNGKLQMKNDAWYLVVESRSFDMLLDQLPWSFSTINFGWMDRVIFVHWR